MPDSAATGNPPCVVPLIPPTTNNPQAVEWITFTNSHREPR